MVIDMNEARVRMLEQVREVLAGSRPPLRAVQGHEGVDAERFNSNAIVGGDGYPAHLATKR